jgi:CRP-like cAMP-binding protein
MIPNSDQLLFFRTCLENFVQFSDEEFLFYASKFQLKSIKKDEYFLRAGEISRYTGFICKGGFRYFEAYDEKEFTVDLMFEGRWACNYKSFLKHSPSTLSIQALEDSELLIVSYDDLQELQNANILYDRLTRKIIEQAYFRIVNRFTQIKCNTPEQDYQQLLLRHPDIFERVQIQHIASYLGIVPQSLSRIRKRTR